MATTATKEGSPSKRRAPSTSPKARAQPREAREAERRVRRPRRALSAGSALLLVGLAMVGVDSSSEGAVVTLIGLLILIYGIHSFGRLGPDEPATIERAST
jgi:hypothetical protein